VEVYAALLTALYSPMSPDATVTVVGRYPKVLRRVSRILIKEGLQNANLFYIFE
jgi:hypothetical protein